MAQTAHDHHAHDTSETVSSFTVHAHTATPITENVSTPVHLFLSNEGKGVAENQLKTVHTEKIHVLIIDPTLTDYHHVHPVAAKKAGEYIFDFTPHTTNNYRLWLDITPKNGTQQYVMTDLPGKNKENPPVEKKLALSATVENYHFNLSFDKPLIVGKSVMGSVKVTDKNNKDVTQLEPIMEAFAHIVAFNQDYQSILHVHPMGAEPKDKSARGGPRIDFHLMPTAAGFVKIFVQVKINGKEIFAPFGVEVKA